jgi:HK97 family phage prohead protease
MQKYFQITNKSFEEEGVTNHQELWNKIKGEYKGFSVEMPVAFEKTVTKKEDKEEVTYTMVFSTPDKDRHGDIVVQNWTLDSYRANPVLIDSHNYDSITHIIGRVLNIRVDNEQLKGELEFALMNPKGQLAKEMVEGGFINTSSVGFIPTEFDNEGRILKSELLENSLVSVPANARALFEKIAKEAEVEVAELKKEIIEEKPIEKINETKTILSQKREVLKSVIQVIKEMDEMTSSERNRQVLAEVHGVLKEMEVKVNKWDEKRRKVFLALRSL